MENQEVHTNYRNNFGSLEQSTMHHYGHMDWAYDTIRTNFEEQSDYVPTVVQITPNQAIVVLINARNGSILNFTVQCAKPKRLLTLMDFVYAVFNERTSEGVKDVLRPLDFQEFCTILVRYTESAEYEKGCEVFLLGEQ